MKRGYFFAKMRTGTGKRLSGFYSVDKGLYSFTGPSVPLADGFSVMKMERFCASGARLSMEFFFDHVGKWNTV